MNTDAKIREEINSIKKSLAVIMEHMAWLIRPADRFTIGQRVEWSRKGYEAGFPTRKKSRKGTVKSIRSFSICVRLDGLKHPAMYHHSFFNPVIGEKLF